VGSLIDMIRFDRVPLEKIYFSCLEEKRASTRKGYLEIWENHLCDRIGNIQLRSFRTADACKVLKAIADENDLSKATLQHIKGVLSGIFTNAKNESGVMFHSGAGDRMDFDKLARRAIMPVVKGLGLDWYGWHGFRRGIASNLYELGANEKTVQRILRHAKPHVTKDRYIKAFDPAVPAAMKRLEATLDVVSQSAPRVHRIN
jgi:integrase